MGNVVGTRSKHARRAKATMRTLNGFLVGLMILATLAADGRLRPASLEDEDFQGAYLPNQRWAYANLTNADLARADLSGSDLRSAVMRRTCLSEAVLRNTDLRNADLSGSDLIAADLRGARLAGARLDGAYYNRETRWPEAFDPASAGARRHRGERRK